MTVVQEQVRLAPGALRVDLRRLARTTGHGTSLPLTAPGADDHRGAVPVVATAQLLLRPYYATIRVDGSFGDQTRAAVMAFQVRTHRDVTGDLRPDDWAILCDRSTVTIGSKGNAVRAVQQLLNHHLPADHHLTVDGVFGTGTMMIVHDQQARAGLPANGIVSRETYSVLLRD